jgi:hypothetical protein
MMYCFEKCEIVADTYKFPIYTTLVFQALD